LYCTTRRTPLAYVQMTTDMFALRVAADRMEEEISKFEICENSFENKQISPLAISGLTLYHTVQGKVDLCTSPTPETIAQATRSSRECIERHYSVRSFRVMFLAMHASSPVCLLAVLARIRWHIRTWISDQGLGTSSKSRLHFGTVTLFPN